MSSPQWSYLVDSVIGTTDTVGPISESELSTLAKQGKIGLTTLISSPTRTHGGWIPAERVPALVRLIEEGNRERQEARAREQAERLERQRAAADARENARRQLSLARSQLTAEASKISDHSDSALVISIRERVQALLTSQETVEYIAVQKKLLNVVPDAVIATNKRLIFYRAKLLGQFEFQDFNWFDLHNAHAKQGVLTSQFWAQHVSGRAVWMDYLTKESALALYRMAQEREEQARLARHNLHLEAVRAGATQVNLQTNVTTAQMPLQAAQPGPYINPALPPSSNDLVGRLQTLKSMMENGLISSEDFERRKQEILSQI